MEMNELVQSTHDAFLVRLASTGLEQLDLPTPCEGWSVADLLRHVTGGNRMACALLEGAEAAVVGPLFAEASTLAGQGLLDAAGETTEEARDALAGLRDPSQSVAFPLGPMPAGRLAAFRSTDLLIHAWDLARSIGADEELPEEAVEAALGGLELMASSGSVPPGMFGTGASGALGPDAGPQERLIDLSGRRP
jgi:uncharacterized protein (TIGR03086 family)